MRPYEVMVIFDTSAEAPAIQAVVDRALETISTSGGNPGTVDRWGRRPFAYEVKHKREGYYVLVDFTGENQTVADLDRLLSLADEVLRHKVIRLPDKVAGRKRSGPPPKVAPPEPRPRSAAAQAAAAAREESEAQAPAPTPAPAAEPVADEAPAEVETVDQAAG